MALQKWFAINHSDGKASIQTRTKGAGILIAQCQDPKDAPLLAAAPDLLEALEACLGHGLAGGCGGKFPCEVTEQAEAAIQKAKPRGGSLT